MTITFTVYGKAITQGSKKAFVIPGTRRASVVDVHEKQLKVWRPIVAHAAAMALDRRGPDLPTGPMTLRIHFLIGRPKSHYRTGRNSHLLKDSSPKHHTQSPDALKLGRAVEDALSGVLYNDDSQNNCLHITKEWGGLNQHETTITVTPTREVNT